MLVAQFPLPFSIYSRGFYVVPILSLLSQQSKVHLDFENQGPLGVHVFLFTYKYLRLHQFLKVNSCISLSSSLLEFQFLPICAALFPTKDTCTTFSRIKTTYTHTHKSIIQNVPLPFKFLWVGGTLTTFRNKHFKRISYFLTSLDLLAH